MRRRNFGKMLALICAAVLLMIGRSADTVAQTRQPASPTVGYVEPPVGSPLRKAVLDALRPMVARDLAQPVRFKVGTLRVGGGWAFVSATPLDRNDRPIDWTRTRYARDFRADMMSDVILALLQQTGGGWTVREYALGPTDVAWIDWIAKHRLPRALFDPTAAARRSEQPTPAPTPSRATNESGGWTTHELQGLALSVPAAWSMLSAVPRMSEPAPLSGAAFAERPGAVEHGGLLTLSAGDGAAGYADGLDADDMLGAGMAELDGRRASRVDFAVKDRRNDTRGFDITLDAADGGKALVLTCRGPSLHWPRLEPVCRRIVASVRLERSLPDAAGAPAGGSEPTTAKAEPAGLPPPPSTTQILVPGQPADAWRTTSWGRGNPRFVTRDRQGVVVEYPAATGGGGAGVISTTSPVRLGDIGAGARTRLTFRFDGSRTDAFRISLCPAQIDSCWSERGYTLFWQTGSDGRRRLMRKSNDGKHREIAIATSVPARLTLSLSRSGVEIAGDGLDAVDDAWELLAPFLAFDIEVQAAPLTETEATRLALTEIEVEQQPAIASGAAEPAPGVLPLPSKPIFPGGSTAAWKPFAASGGDFSAFASASDDALVVRVPPQRRWGWTGLVTTAPELDVPPRAALAPRRLRAKVAPGTTSGFVVMLAPDPSPHDPWLQSKVWLEWQKRADGGGTLKLASCGSASRIATMTTPAGWNGEIELLLRPGLVEAGLDGRWRLAAGSPCVADGNRFHVAMFAAPAAENASASLTLHRLAIDRMSPPGMSRQLRLELVDDHDFDPREFIDDLADLTKDPTP